MLEFKGIWKAFFGNYVLQDINFKVEPGQIMALVGQNGAGKSTLMKILSGVYQPDRGEMLIDGKPVKFRDASESEKSGIGIVYQELSSLPSLSVSENVVAGKDVRTKRGFLDLKKQKEVVREVFERLDVDIDINRRLDAYPASTQQLVEIAKMTYRNPRIIVFDEPTTSLTAKEREKLFEVMNKMKRDGMMIIFITHYLDDIVLMADQCVILKDGKIAYRGSMEGMDEEKIISYMIGQKLENFYPAVVSHKTDKVALKLEGLSGGIVKEGNLQVNYGEVVGLAGLIGAGRTELMYLVIGTGKKESGKIMVDGRTVDIRDPSDALNYGIAYVSEDRKISGLHLKMPIEFNIILPSVVKRREEAVSHKYFVNRKAERKMAKRMIDHLEIKCNSPAQRVNTLSGGNQQKISVAKWIAAEPRIYIFDEPTKGIDVLTKKKMYNIIRDLAQDGCAVIVISSYCSELIGICDRIDVMTKGSFVASFDAGVQEHEVMLAIGGEGLS